MVESNLNETLSQELNSLINDLKYEINIKLDADKALLCLEYKCKKNKNNSTLKEPNTEHDTANYDQCIDQSVSETNHEFTKNVSNVNLTEQLNNGNETFNGGNDYNSKIQNVDCVIENYETLIYNSIENDGKILKCETYNTLRTTLQNNKWTQNKHECIKLAEIEFVNFLTKENKLQGKQFLQKFEEFVNTFPDVPHDFLKCRKLIMDTNISNSNVDTCDAREKRFDEFNDDFANCHKKFLDLKNKYLKTAKDPESNTVKKQDNLKTLFEKQYPTESKKIRRVFEILNNLERGEKLDSQIKVISTRFGWDSGTVMKLQSYFNADSGSKQTAVVHPFENETWYSDEDMNWYGKVLETYDVDIDTQFSNRLTADAINTLPPLDLLKENYPRYVCFNIGGKGNIDYSGMHWVAMLLVRQDDVVTILYKDSKGNWNNSAEEIESIFMSHYNNKVEFITHSGVEQEDGSSCGPMTLNNLAIMAQHIKEVKDNGRNGISELINKFKTSEIRFTTQEQVPIIRKSHLTTHKRNGFVKQNDANIESLSSIKTKLHIGKDGDLKDISIQQKENLDIYLTKIDEYYDKIKDWDVKHFDDWSCKLKNKLSQTFSYSERACEEICEAIAIMDRANEVATGGHRFRNTQKIAILIFMQSDTKGHISQINTGEGKTSIISVVAALKVMQGFKTHVITSNNLLAADGVKANKLFYGLFNIAVADNNPDDKYKDGPKCCYSKDVVYGSINSFQFDWLRDSFEKLQTLGDANFNNTWVFLDEIDSLLIDQGSNIAKLSGPFPGMESFRYIYINLWVALNKVKEDETNKMSQKLKHYFLELSSDSDMNEYEKQLKYEDYECKLEENYLAEVKKRIEDQKLDIINKTLIPHHLHQYAEDSLDKWVENAFAAKYHYNENVEYKLSEDKNGEKIIIPVDNQNTGVSMENTILSNGLHQFLQIKHTLGLTYESLTSCYVSNLDYIKKYSNKISGLTGTLGSEPEQSLLSSVFNLQFSKIPPFKKKQFTLLPGKILKDEEFSRGVALAALCEIRGIIQEIEAAESASILNKTLPRAVLIVCTSILDVNNIAEEIKKEARISELNPNILIFIDETDAHNTEAILDTNTIVIATNLAGRGTDFKTSGELEKNGGLHVIEAFLPCNKRVEDQGLGRTARQGNKGSGQIIVRQNEVKSLGFESKNIESLNFNAVIRIRDKLEAERLNDIRENKIRELEFMGQIFEKFSAEYGELKEKHSVGVDVIKWVYVLRDLKEKWAFWLEKQAYTSQSIKKITSEGSNTCEPEQSIKHAVEKEYRKFQSEARSIINGTIMHNPYYGICLSGRYLEDHTNKAAREKAKREIENALAISKNDSILYAAYMKLFEIDIESSGVIMQKFKKAVGNLLYVSMEEPCPDYKERAILNLEKAEKAISIEIDYLQELFAGKLESSGSKNQESSLASILCNQEQAKISDSNSTLFVRHLQSRLVALDMFKHNITDMIIEIDKSGTAGIALLSKVPGYLGNLDPSNMIKKYITQQSVDELEYVGMSAVYRIGIVKDVPSTIVTSSRELIAAALSLTLTAALLPFVVPVCCPVANGMLSEGITDILTALINQDVTDFKKSKLMNFRFVVLTFGTTIILNSATVLQKGTYFCRELVTKLTAVTGKFAAIASCAAKSLEILANSLEKIVKAMQIALDVLKMRSTISGFILPQSIAAHEMLNQSNSSPEYSINATISSVANKAISIKLLKEFYEKLKPLLKERINLFCPATIAKDLRLYTFNDIETIKKNCKSFDKSIQECNKVLSKNKEILKLSSHWKLQKAINEVHILLAEIEIENLTRFICDKFVGCLIENKNIFPPYTHSEKNEYNESFLHNFIEYVTDVFCSLIVQKIRAQIFQQTETEH